MQFEKLLEYSPYELNKDQKKQLLTERLLTQTQRQGEDCPEYRLILNRVGFDEHKVDSYEDLPFLPVRVFKELALKSVPDDKVVKTMTSSGTTGQKTSKIYLDKTTSANQQKAMVKIVSDFTGSARMPMIIIDCPSVLRDRRMFSARGAGILGFSIFGSKRMYALDDDMNLNLTQLKEFLGKYKDRKILLFGFTFMIWQHFYKALVQLKDETGEQLDLSNAVLIHGGGWKKLVDEAVSAEEFQARMTEVCGLSDIHDYYGMVEQTGCIYMQCECGHLHASIFSDVIVRNPRDFSECSHGEKGVIQVVSTIPESYPGHSLLTEDEGVILGEDDCPCGRKGKYFQVLGRLKDAEIRGCSDTYAADHMRNYCDFNEPTNAAYQKISYLLGDQSVIEHMPTVSPMTPFSDEVLAFFDDLSRELMTDKTCRAYADVVTLGFWLRSSSMHSMRKKYLRIDDESLRIGRGVAFHIAPSNVPVNFAYSLFTGLLLGNANIVRVPSKKFPQIACIASAIERQLEVHSELRSYIALIRYERDPEINELLSALCDVRIVWGGDATINELRKAALPPRATEITFSDRYSLAVIDADMYLESGDKKRIAQDFYNDTYLSDQNACTSPRVVVWHGKQIDVAKQIFWDELHALAVDRYQLQAVQSVDKLLKTCLVAADASENIGHVRVVPHEDQLLVRLQVDRLRPELMRYRGNSGYFYEYDCTDLLELAAFCNDTHCQTLSYFGDGGVLRPLLQTGLRGIDRVVPIGHTMDFDLIWDGYQMVEHMTRVIAIR